MAGGRCAGCGYANVSVKTVRGHTQTCEGFIALFKSEPARALDPLAEALRFAAEQSTDLAVADAEQAKEEARLALKEQMIAMANHRHAMNREKWLKRQARGPAKPVAMPPDGILVSNGRTPAQVLVLDSLKITGVLA